LTNVLHDNPSPEEFPWDVRLLIGYDVSRAMEYLHNISPPIIHRDLRSPNVFVSSLVPSDKFHAKVGDFGMSQHIASAFNEILPTWQWLAPEVINPTSISYDEKSDVYSFAIVMWEMISCKHPFAEYDEFVTKQAHTLTDKELADPQYLTQLQTHGFIIEGKVATKEEFKRHDIISAIINKDLRPSIAPNACVDWFSDLVKKCWVKDPQQRPAFKDIVNEFNKRCIGQ